MTIIKDGMSADHLPAFGSNGCGESTEFNLEHVNACKVAFNKNASKLSAYVEDRS